MKKEGKEEEDHWNTLQKNTPSWRKMYHVWTLVDNNDNDDKENDDVFRVRSRSFTISLLLNISAIGKVYLPDWCAETMLHAATLRCKLQMKCIISPWNVLSHHEMHYLTMKCTISPWNALSHPVTVYWHQAHYMSHWLHKAQMSGKVPTWVTILKSLEWLKCDLNHSFTSSRRMP